MKTNMVINKTISLTKVQSYVSTVCWVRVIPVDANAYHEII